VSVALRVLLSLQLQLCSSTLLPKYRVLQDLLTVSAQPPATTSKPIAVDDDEPNEQQLKRQSGSNDDDDDVDEVDSDSGTQVSDSDGSDSE
jgi:hypothetical protein